MMVVAVYRSILVPSPFSWTLTLHGFPAVQDVCARSNPRCPVPSVRRSAEGRACSCRSSMEPSEAPGSARCSRAHLVNRPEAGSYNYAGAEVHADIEDTLAVQAVTAYGAVPPAWHPRKAHAAASQLAETWCHAPVAIGRPTIRFVTPWAHVS